ncbi:MAG: hypothetical protein AB7F50_03190 [Fimbriimonadaceae bacterium]
MRSFLLLILALACGPALAQKPPSDGSCSWLLSRSDTVDTVVEVTWKWTPGVRFADSYHSTLVCDNSCKGNKHFLHDQCDLSCDVECETVHEGSIPPSVSLHSPIGELVDKATTFGVVDAGPLMRNVRYGTKQKIDLDTFATDPANALPFKLKHWNRQPCSYRRKAFADQKFDCAIEYAFKRFTKLADGSEVVTEGPKLTQHMSVLVPVPNSIVDKDPVVACACSIVSNGDDEYGLMLDESGKETGVACVSNGTATLLDGQQLATMGLAFQGEDMNTFTVTVANKPPDCDKLVIPAGFEFICADGSAQDTLLAKDFEFTFVAGSSTGVQAPRGPFDFLAAEARTLCLNIKRREPSPAKKYTLSMPRHPGTVRLARMSNEARFFGPWDQVRLWIFTDRASLDEIGKVLIPGPSASMYLRELHTLVQERLIELDPKADAKIMDSKLLTALNPETEALEWFVGWKMRHDRAGTLKFVRSAGKAMAAHFEGRSPQDAAVGLANLVAALARTGDDGTAAALDMLADKALAPHMAATTAEPGFGQLLMALARTEDATVAGRLLDLAKDHPGPGARQACLNANPGLPQAVLDRAATLARG